MKRKVCAAFFGVLIALGVPGLSNAWAGEHSTSSPETQARLRLLIESADRPDAHKVRDRYRHPFETLTFFGIAPEQTVIEIWPGGQGGFYRRIIAPLLAGSGRYIPVGSRSSFPGPVEGVDEGSADMVLVFRAHGFMIYEKPVQKYYDRLYALVKPGGIFAIVDHAGNEAIPQDPEGESGYVNQSHVVMMAEKAGFELLVQSDVNRNPRDTKDHPRGVYSLPPTLAGSRFQPAARQRFLEIGETDRFTLKFIKPE